MQILAINGSPRKKWNTATILRNVLEGACKAAPGAQAETANLYEYDYRGCISCFQCKRVGGPSYGKCAVRDGIAPLLEKALHADALVFGSPIYFGDMTGMLRCFLERLLFPCFVYDRAYTSIAPKKLRCAFVYTMNVPHDMMEENHYPERLGLMESFAGHLFGGAPAVLYVNNTLQVEDYSKYMMKLFSETEKKAWREKHFPEDCEKARKLGAELVA